MNAGYVRLSRDDDKRNYTSIENQKLIIKQFAADKNLTVDRWYEDDGVSGYRFDRPGFNQLLEDLDKDLDTVFVKDFSRLGRHNAKVLLLLDDFIERGKQLIAIDDNYDSCNPDDDTIGIKTWYNERYVKDTSKKIRHALNAKQKEGTLKTQPPFGYRRSQKDNAKFEIVPEEAEYVKLIANLYLNGLGYRKISTYLTEQGAPTPSMVRHQQELKNNQLTKRSVATQWSDSMVKDILGNDFYIGTLRLHKRARSTVHGKDKRVPKEEQYIFENTHPAILDKATFDLIQTIKEERAKTNYRGSRSPWPPSSLSNPFGSCLFCKDCGSRLTPVKRTTSKGERKYYICSTYNTKGKRFCPKSHLIHEEHLMAKIMQSLKLNRTFFHKILSAYDMQNLLTPAENPKEKQFQIQTRMDEKKQQLKVLISQKIKDLADTDENKETIMDSYDSLQKEILAQIHALEIQLHSFSAPPTKMPEAEEQPENTSHLLDKMIEKGILERKYIEILVKRIEVDEYGQPEITWNHPNVHTDNLH